MKYCMYYILLLPLKEEYFDNPQRQPDLSFPIVYMNSPETLDVAVLSDKEGKPELIRLKIPDLHGEQLPEEWLQSIQTVKEHMITSLSMTYYEDISISRLVVFKFFDEGSDYELSFTYKQHGELVYNPVLTEAFFKSTYEHRIAMRLFIDGRNLAIPLQYRFLSLYKMLEQEFRSKGEWKKSELTSFLDIYKNDFELCELKGTPSSIIHDTRDKCAHIRHGKNREIAGVTHFNNSEAAKTEKVLKILQKICKDLLNKKFNGTAVIH